MNRSSDTRKRYIGNLQAMHHNALMAGVNFWNYFDNQAQGAACGPNRGESGMAKHGRCTGPRCTVAFSIFSSTPCKVLYFDQPIDSASALFDELLGAALDGRSVNCIELVLGQLAASVRNRNDVLNEEATPHIQYYDHVCDEDGRIGKLLATIGEDYPPLLLAFLAQCSLLRVDGFNEMAYIADHEQVVTCPIGARVG